MEKAKEETVIQLPIEGYMTRLAPPEQLVKALLTFAETSGKPLQADKEENHIFVRECFTENGISAKQSVLIKWGDYICYTTLQHCAPTAEEGIPRDYFRMINLINTQLYYGSFEICEQTGDVSYKTHYKPNDSAGTSGLYLLMEYPLDVIDTYKEALFSEDLLK